MKNEDILDSWKDISIYLERDARTCHRWEKELGLPICRIDKESSRSKVFAYKSEIDQWLKEKASCKEIEKKSFLKNRGLIIGLVSGLILILSIFTFLYFTHIKTLTSSSDNFAIAVLPFENLNLSEYDEYLSEGINNEIINNLMRLKKLKVIHGLSVSRYGNIKEDSNQLGEKLKAGYLLKGKIRKTDDKINLAVQLIKTKDGTTILRADFTEPLENIFYIPENISLQISELLNIIIEQKFPVFFSYGKTRDYIAWDNNLQESHILKRLNKENNDPWKLYNLGKYYSKNYTLKNNNLAIGLFSQAIEIDNNFVPAYLGLAQNYVNYINLNWNFNKKWLIKAEELVKKAQIIKPDIPEYFILLTKINLIKEIAFNENTKSIAFNTAEEGIKKYPNHPQLNSIVGYCYFLKFANSGNESDFNKALKYKEKSFLLEPFSIDNIVYTELLMLNKEFSRAMEICNIIKKHDSSFMANFRLGEIYYYLEDLDKSEAIFKQLESFWKYKSDSLLYLGMIASRKGEKEKAQKIVQQINVISPETSERELRISSIYISLGKRELAYKYLKRFFSKTSIKNRKFIYHKYINLDKNFDSVINEEKFKKIIIK